MTPEPGPRHSQREHPRWPAAPPWRETREEFEARVAEYDRREAILARHNMHVVHGEVNTGFQPRIDGRPGIWVVDQQSAHACDARGVPVHFDQASYAIEYAWEHLLPPEARAAAGRGAGSGGGEQPDAPGTMRDAGSRRSASGDGC